MTVDATLIARIEACYHRIAADQARAEPHGPLVLFVQQGPGYPLYARPAPGATRAATPGDIAEVRDRQRELGVPEAFEWLHEATPDLLGTAEAAGLRVLRAPLLVLDPGALPASSPGVRLLDPDSATYPGDLAACQAVSAVGFGNPGTAAGPAGPAERDAATRPADQAAVRTEAARTRTGALARALAGSDAEGPLATGVLLRGGDAAEIAGVATLPSARRRGLGAAVTAALARHARDSGVDLVFLSAGSDEIARVYQRIGFTRVGTACIAEPAAG